LSADHFASQKKKSAKGKEKKEKRKQEKEQIAASLEVVKNAQVDVKACFQELKAFHSFERGGCVLTLELSLLFSFSFHVFFLVSLLKFL
jgi:hypothetical protein